MTGERPAAKVITVSDSVPAGSAVDRSGPALVERLTDAGFDVVEQVVVTDGVGPVSAALHAACAGFAGLVVTTGGTGLAPRDQTPEASLAVIERQAPGLAEAMRAVDPRGRLSRGVAGVVGSSLVLNTPGSPGGAVDHLAAVVDVLPHALALLAGDPSGHHPHHGPP